jgi:ABC-type multidrug transport system fused ATPase/permease subunit
MVEVSAGGALPQLPAGVVRMAVFVRLFGLLRPYRAQIILMTAAAILVAAASLAPGLIIRWFIDRVLLPGHKLAQGQFVSGLWITVGLLTGIGFVTRLLSYIQMKYSHLVGQRLVLAVRTRTYEHIQRLSLKFYETRRTGEIMSRLTNDVEVLDRLASDAVTDLVVSMLRLVFALGILFWVSWKLTLVAFLPLPILGWFIKVFVFRIRGVYRKIRERLAEINAKLSDNLQGIRVIKSFSMEDYEAERFYQESERYYQMSARAIELFTRFFSSVNFFTATGQAIVLGAGGWLIYKGQLTVGDLTLFVFSWLQPYLYQPLQSLARTFDTVLRALAAGERIFELLDTEQDVRDKPQAAPMPRIKGQVEFCDVSFGYDEAGEVFRGINISARPGERIALVGRSGAGKTTIINLIPRFYDPTQGQILIDGVDIRDVQQESLRSQIAMVLQDTFLFNGTIRENILYGRPDASDEEMIAAAKTANAHEFIMSFPGQYEQEIGERGIKLSGGQKQRISIARAVLADPRILILDEATSSVDTESEILIQEAMERLMRNRTTFVIAHRLSTVKRADQIVALAGGRIAETGRHDELLESGGVYAEMYELQFSPDLTG